MKNRYSNQSISPVAAQLMAKKPVPINNQVKDHNKNRISSFVHRCTYHFGYFNERYGDCPTDTFIEQYREISFHAGEAMNALAETWLLFEEEYSEEAIHYIRKTIAWNYPSISDPLLGRTQILGHPHKTNPLMLANCLHLKLHNFCTYLEYFPTSLYRQFPKTASEHCLKVYRLLDGLRIVSGKMPKWPRKMKR